MENTKNFVGFTNLYPLQKTLRFELKPIGKTLENLKGSGIIKEDENRAESYKHVKKWIDDFHKDFIDRVLKDFSFSSGILNEYLEAQGRDDNTLKEIKEKLRKEIGKAFKDSTYEIKSKESKSKEIKSEDSIPDESISQFKFEDLFKKELITTLLPYYINEKEISEDEKSDIKSEIDEFNRFTTYFYGFHENRKNIYSSEAKSTAISYRIVHENLPKFIDNIESFKKIKETLDKKVFDEIYKAFEECLNVVSIEEMFSLDYFNKCLTQNDIAVYNYIIGGKVEEGVEEKIKGLNEYINLYNQKQKDSSKKLPKLNILYKQILSDRESLSWIPESYQSDNQLISSIKKYSDELEREKTLVKIKELLSSIKDFDLNKVYIKNDPSVLSEISNKLFDDYSKIGKGLQTAFEKDNSQTKSEDSETYYVRIKKLIKKSDSFSIEYLNKCLKERFDDSGTSLRIENYFLSSDLFDKCNEAHTQISEILNGEYESTKRLSQDEKTVEKIKDYLDSLVNILHFVNPLLGSGEEADKDFKFYGIFTDLFNTLKDIIPLYNMVRNYITSKSYSNEKIKLNFQNDTLLNGWDLNKEKDNTSILLRKDGLYYLGIMNKRFNKIFEKSSVPNHCKLGGVYEKMEYKLLPGPNKMLPKVFFSKKGREIYNPNTHILNIYEQGTFKKGVNFSINDCHDLIDFYKNTIQEHPDWKNFGFKFSQTKSFKDIGEFYNEVLEQGYKVTFINVPESYINELVNEGKLYLFQLYNKDFSTYSKGTPNMYTMYWKALFDEDNLKDPVFKLNGEAEIFYRKKSLPQVVTHKRDIAIKNKNILNRKDQSTFEFDLIKDKRYTTDKFLFHVPISFNFRSKGITDLNSDVREYIQEQEDLHFIGIDRGERHLLYLTVINSYGEIVEQYSLNKIINEYKGNKYETDYHDLLTKKEKERDEKRKSWKTIENIKEIKQGYLSQVINKIANLMVKYNAVVILEDLNAGFKRQRQKFERSVYQQFEKALIDKLNFFVDKKTDMRELGGLFNAYQLANQFVSFKKMGKQNGFIFYIPAWNTSKIDPVTGFVNFFNTKYESVEKSRSFFSRFDSIVFNQKNNCFDFTFDYMNFPETAGRAEGTPKTSWTISTYGERVRTFRDPEHNSEWVSKVVDITSELKALLEKFKINIDDIKSGIDKQDSKEFFTSLLHLLHLTIQMRNSIPNSGEDYIISPVANDNGEYFDSRKADSRLPQNADANGAYNIARKGLLLARKIQDSADIQDINLSITNKEWLNFAQKTYKK